MMHTTKLGRGVRGHGQYPECRVGWVQSREACGIKSREVCGVQSREVCGTGVARYAAVAVEVTVVEVVCPDPSRTAG